MSFKWDKSITNVLVDRKETTEQDQQKYYKRIGRQKRNDRTGSTKALQTYWSTEKKRSTHRDVRPQQRGVPGQQVRWRGGGIDQHVVFQRQQ